MAQEMSDTDRLKIRAAVQVLRPSAFDDLTDGIYRRLLADLLDGYLRRLEWEAVE